MQRPTVVGSGVYCWSIPPTCVACVLHVLGVLALLGVAPIWSADGQSLFSSSVKNDEIWTSRIVPAIHERRREKEREEERRREKEREGKKKGEKQREKEIEGDRRR